MESKRTQIRREILFIVIVIILSLILRAIYLWQYYDSAYWASLTIDAKFHYLWAKSIAGGDILGHEAFFRAPFYPYFLALNYLIFGGRLLGIVIMQNIIGILSMLLVFKLARDIFGFKSAAICMILYLFTFDFVFFESELLLDFMLVFFLPLVFLVVFKAESKNRRVLWFIAGIILGLATATRPTVLITLVIVPLFFLQPGAKSFSFKKWAINSLLVILGTATVMLPVAVRNAAVANEFTALPSQGGINFYIGNNPYSNGWSAAMPPPLLQNWQYADCKHIAENEVGKALKPSQVSRFWFEKGIDFWLDSPSEALKLTSKKAYLLFTNTPISNNRNILQFKEKIGISKIMIVSWWLIFPCGLLGMIAAYKRNHRARLLMLFIAIYSIIIVFFFITSRFRLPLIPFWIIFSSYGILYIYENIKEKKTGKLIASTILITGGIVFSLSNIYRIDFANPDQELYSGGNRLFAAGQYEEAKNKFHRLLQTNPAYPQANMNLAASFVKLGDLDSAEFYYNRELNANPDSALALSSLAEIARVRGESRKAYEYASSALSMKPFFLEILINYVKASRAALKQTEALAKLETIQNQYEKNPYYHFYKGVLKIDLAAGNSAYYEEAEKDFVKSFRLWEKQSQPTYERDPSIYAMLFSEGKKEALMAKSYANIGIINLGQGRHEKAFESFQMALKYDITLRQAKTGLLEASMRTGRFAKALQLADELLPEADRHEIPAYMLYRAQAFYNLGDEQNAVNILEKIIIDYPEYQPAYKILEAIKTGG